MNAHTSKPKPAAKAATTAAKTAAPKTTAKAPVKSSVKTTVKKEAPPAAAPAAPALAPAPVSSSGVLRSPRPSSRLTQLTVPSQVQMAVPVSAPKKDSKLANNWKAKSAEELSDAEILAMPDSEYMNEKQVAFFRHKLVLLKQDMHNNAGETTEHLREDTVVVPDPADRATIEEEHALELRTRDRERKLLKKIEQSIGRIDAGDYGYCDETGEPIGVGRLLARPTATLSLEAQQRRELKQKMFGD